MKLKTFKRKYLLVAILLLIALVAAWPAAAQGVDPNQMSTGQATLTAPEGQLTVGDPIVLTLSVTHPADHHVIAPELEAEWGDFVVASVSPPETVANGDGSMTTKLAIDARLFAPGTFTTLPLAVKLADGAGQVIELTAQPATVEIGSVLIEGDSELRDIKPQASLPYVNLLPWVGAGVAAALVVAVIVLIARRLRARRVLSAIDNRLPHEVALDELARVEGLRLPDEARFKEHYSLVSDCLRLYMERRVRVPMLERTTAEIERGLKDTALSRQIAGQFVSLLDISDLVKFSKFTPDAVSAYGFVQSARQFVVATKPSPQTGVDAGSTTGNGMPIGEPAGAGFSQNGNYSHMEVGA